MSYIVKGANIPVSCDSCPLMRWNDYGIDGELQYCNILHAISEHEEGQRDADCPLAEIPPHGRLIDADALEEYCKRQVRDEWNQKAGTSWSYAFEEFEDIVYNRETIIEAEG